MLSFFAAFSGVGDFRLLRTGLIIRVSMVSFVSKWVQVGFLRSLSIPAGPKRVGGGLREG